MNKSKKELYEENKKLKKILKAYSNFWENDALEDVIKQLTFTKKLLYIVSIVFLLFIAFLIGKVL